MAVIDVRQLAKTFETKQGTVEAVSGIDLSMGEGEILGLLGPNGAGKTTTMRMLTTLLAPSGGSANIAGLDLLRRGAEVRKHIGYVSQAGGTRPAAPVRRDLVLQARLHGMSREQAGIHVDALLAQFGLSEFSERPCGSLSGGQRRRVDLAMGLVHRPRVLFLDEPTANLDPLSRQSVWEAVRRLRDELGTSVLLSTHYLDEADSLCDRVLILDEGRIVAEDEPEALKQRIARERVEIEVDTSEVEIAARALENADGVLEVSSEGGQLGIACRKADEALPVVVRELDRANVRITTIRAVRPTLDDVFAALTRSGSTAATA